MSWKSTAEAQASSNVYNNLGKLASLQEQPWWLSIDAIRTQFWHSGKSSGVDPISDLGRKAG